MAFVESITFKGKRVLIGGEIPEIGKEAPDFTYVDGSLKEGLLHDLERKAKVILSIPSIDTEVCAKEARHFNEMVEGMEDIEILFVSRDLPFALNRYFAANKLLNLSPVSDYRYNEFAQNYGVEILDGPMKGLLARAIFIMDDSNILHHIEIVKELSDEPDYDKALQVIQKLILS